MLTSHGRLDSSIKREKVRLICNVFNDTYDLANFVGAFAQALDLLGSLLHVLTNEHHALDCLPHSLLTTVRIMQGILRRVGTCLSIASNVLNEDSQGLDSLCCVGDLGHLSLRGLRQLHGTIKNPASSVRYLHSRCLHASDHFGKLFYHIVERVSQHAQSVRCHFSLNPQVTVTHGTHFLEQLFDLCL